MSKHLHSNFNAVCFFLLLTVIHASAQPTINSFTPASGLVGTNVIISGNNFNGVGADIVYFGAVKASVINATTTSITALAPPGSTYQPISVLNFNTGLTGYASKPFIPVFTNPFGTGISSNFYKPKVDFTSGNGPVSVAIGDLDGDGKPDMVVGNVNSNTISVFRNTSVFGSINTSSFAAKVDFASGTFTSYVTIADINGDGRPDLVVVNNNNVSILVNTGTTGTIDATSFEPKVDFDLVFTGPVAVAVSDLDGDGKPDLITANTNGTVSVLRNTSTQSTISMAAKVDFAAGGTPFFISVGDLDGDGKPDLVVANASVPTNTVSVLRNTSIKGSITSGSFAAKVPFATGPTPRCVVIGDIDGDGKPDLVVANSDPANTTISILRNISTSGIINASSFAAKMDFKTGLSPYYIALGDADGDARIDIVVANQNSNTFSILRNTSTPGNINTDDKVDFSTGVLPRSVIVGDIDGDAMPEIVVSNYSTGSVSVFQIDPSALPVTITNLKAYIKNTGVQIEWTSEQENNIEKYEIERSQDAQYFMKIGTVASTGNSSVPIKYDFFDPKPFEGVNFYRIKIIETGQVFYSEILKVNTSNNVNGVFTIYPNPVVDNSIYVKLNLPQGNYNLTLFNNTGRQIMKKEIKYVGGISIETIKLSNPLPAGMYMLKLTGENINLTRQVIKMND